MARFFRRGVTKIRFAPAIADITAPTTGELTAGVDLSPEIAEIGGFNLSNDPIATPNLAERFTPTIEGEDTTDASTLTFYDQDNSETIREALAKGTAGYLVFMPYGAVAGKRIEVWPVRTTGVNDEITMGNDPARFVVGFGVTATPEQEAEYPA